MLNRYQWFVLSIGLFIFGVWLLKFAPDCSPRVEGINELMIYGANVEDIKVEAILLNACNIRRYAISIPALFSVVFGIIFFIFGFLEPKKK